MSETFWAAQGRSEAVRAFFGRLTRGIPSLGRWIGRTLWRSLRILALVMVALGPNAPPPPLPRPAPIEARAEEGEGEDEEL